MVVGLDSGTASLISLWLFANAPETPSLVDLYLPWIAVASLGALLGATEIIGRYRDEPLQCLLTPPGIVYMVVNMCASLSAYGLALVFHWRIDLGANPGPADGPLTPSAQWTLVLVAGLSAMALFRSSLFIRRIGDKDVGIGPGAVLTTLLEVTDRYVDRLRGQKRVDNVNKIMAGLDFAKISAELPPYCLSLLQNPSDDMQRDLKAAVDLIRSQPVDDELKLRLLGLQLLNLVGVEALAKAVASLGDTIKKPIPAGGSGPVS